jgi:non-specific serine/threonine protein kinase
VTLEISLSPTGRLIASTSHSNDSDKESGSTWATKLSKTFARNEASALFALAACQPPAPLSTSAAYWREFAALYLSDLCQNPEQNTKNPKPPLPPPETSLAQFLTRIPPMRGAEYLNADILHSLWQELDLWLTDQVSTSKEDLSTWLSRNAPLWHQVGRVCFHLAENKRDPDYPFAFLATYAPSLSRGGKVQYQPLVQALKEYAGERKALINLLAPVQLASEKSQIIKELVESKDIFHPLMWTSQEAYRLLKETPILEQSGILVKLPDWWRKRAHPQVSITIGEKKKTSLGLDALLDFKLELSLGDLKLTCEELQELLDSPEEGLLFIKGQWVEVDKQRLSQALAHWKKVEKATGKSGLSFIEGMRLLAGASANLDGKIANAIDSVKPHHLEDHTGQTQGEIQYSSVNAGSWLKEILANLRDPAASNSSVKLSKSFLGKLRPYQKTGHNWLWFLTSLGLGACLADDMGLGKTVQILALLLSINETKSETARASLLVLPASLLGNWQSEIERFAPSLKFCVLHPSQMEQATNSKKTKSSLSSTTTSTSSALNLAEQKYDTEYDLVLTTYGMLIRQPWLQDKRWRLIILDEAQAIKNPSAQQTKAVKKLKAQSRIALTGTPVENRLGDLWSLFDFLLPGLLGSPERFKRFIKSLDEDEHKNYAPLRNLVTPYILRRLKTDKAIIADLPDKTEMKVFCGLTKEQAALYSSSIRELELVLQASSGIKRKGLVLAFLLRFKQICNHPSQVLGDGIYNLQDSGKFERLRTIAEEVASRQEKMLVFTQYREMTEPLAILLQDIFAEPGLVLHGGTPVARRKSITEAFQQVDGPPFMVLTVKAGGTGLNLTAASHVVHFDRWWNPAVENQATDRAYRIGQHKNVLVHKFICPGTIEEKIDLLMSEKTQLADDILTGGAESLLTEMSDKELLQIVSLDLEKINL